MLPDEYKIESPEHLRNSLENSLTPSTKHQALESKRSKVDPETSSQKSASNNHFPQMGSSGSSMRGYSEHSRHGRRGNAQFRRDAARHRLEAGRRRRYDEVTVVSVPSSYGSSYGSSYRYYDPRERSDRYHDYHSRFEDPRERSERPQRVVAVVDDWGRHEAVIDDPRMHSARPVRYVW